MPNPWDSDPIVDSSGPVYGTPRLPTPQTPAQAQSDQLGVTHLEQQIGQVPLQNENTRVNIEQGKAGIQNQQFNQNQGLRQEYNALPEVKNYSAGIQSLGSALRAPDTPQGDLSIVYAYAKAMDPGSVVREGEMDMATATASIPQAYQADVARLTQGKRLPPEVRTGLIETMRQSVAAMRGAYDQQRSRYVDLAGQHGFDPKEIVGQPLYDAYRPLEEQYIRAHGGTPRDPSAPQADTTERQTGIPSAPHAQEFHDALYSALASKQVKTPAEINAFAQQFNQQNGTAFHVDFRNKETRLAIKAATEGRQFGVENMADPRTLAKINELKQKGSAGDAAAVGATDAITLGGADELAAAGAALKGSLSGQGSFGDLYGVNADANRVYEQFLQDTHPVGYMAGQVAGGIVPGLAVPGGSIGELAAGGAGVGGVYGFNSGEGMGDRLTQAATGAAAGGALGAAIPAAGKGISALRGSTAREIPPLVDPVTGELNQPMDAMRPADRVATMRGYGMETITPGMAGGRTARVLEQGFNNLPASAGRMEDINSAASGELRRSMQGVAQQFGTSKTLNEGGSEIQRGTREWMTRFDGVTSKAYNAIPIASNAQTTLNNTKATLDHLAGKLESNPALQEEIRDPTLLRYLDAINKHGLTWDDLKDFRTFIGNKIGQFRLSEDSRTSDYRSLYAALSEDMRQSAAAQSPRALQAFDRANTLYAQGQQRIDQALARILGPSTQGRPELAASAIQAMTKGGKASGDLRTLAQVRAATIKSGAWDEIASTLIHLGGQPANSEGRAFQPATFVNWYADMSEPARQMLFKPELRKSLDGFVAMTQQLGRLKGLNNTSQTAPVMFGGGALLTVAGAILNPILGLKMGGVLAANYGMGRAWTSPKFVNLITGYGRALAAGNQGAARSQIGRLQKLAATNPELRSPIANLLQSLANDNAPNVGMIAASPNQGPQDPAQPQ